MIRDNGPKFIKLTTVSINTGSSS